MKQPSCQAGSFTLLVACLALACHESSSKPSPQPEPQPAPLTSWVNPFIGTDDANVASAVGGGQGGSTYPGAVVPFGMVQFSPDTPTGSPSGYRCGDEIIEDFSLTHFDGAGCPNNEDLNIMPVARALTSSPGSSWTAYRAFYLKASEAASPGYYTVTLDDATRVELSATRRAGVARFTFPATTQATVLVNVSRMATGDRDGEITFAADGRLEGHTTGGGFCGASGTYPVYFSIRFDRDPGDHGTFSGDAVTPGSPSASGDAAGAYVTFDASTDPVVHMKVGLSYVSIDNARANADAEVADWDFDAVKAGADQAWNGVLGRIQVTGGTDDDRQQFYTALYHVFQSPNIASDVNGEYMGFDGAVHTSTRTVYQNYSGWDIYRSWAALVALIAPEMSDILQSMVLDGEQGGLLPKWSQQNQEDFVMTGDPGPIIVASGYAFGARDFDTTSALALMLKSANDLSADTQGKGAIRGRLNQILDTHWIEDDVSDSLEYNASDFAIARFAKAMGDETSYAALMPRAQYWANLFSPGSGYLQQRSSDGTWLQYVGPSDGSYYTEGNAAQYVWMVPHDYSALFDLMGGKETAVQRLDHLFTQVNAGLEQPYFYIGNEPEHDQPWAYDFAGAPWGTQLAVRRILQGAFSTGAGGLPGNDDLGATSAFFVWSALGMFPVTPGADTLAIHGPLFTSATISLAGGGTLVINGDGAGDDAPFIQSLSVNGTPTTHTYLTYADVAGGATLDFTMGTAPNRSWGTTDADAPPSFNDGWTPPDAAPALGTNLALHKTATGSEPCGSSEVPANAVDGSLMYNSKFCTQVTGTSGDGWLMVDLGETRNVSKIVIKHAGLGGEYTGWNTKGYQILTSTDGASWDPQVTVTDQYASRSYHQLAAPVAARYVKLTIQAPTQDGNQAARIYEFEVYE